MEKLSVEQEKMLEIATKLGLKNIEFSPRSNSVYGWQGATRYKVSDHFAGYKQNGYYKPPRPQCIRDIHSYLSANSAATAGDVADGVQPSSAPQLQADSNFFIKDGERCYFLKISEVRWFEAVGNYSKVQLATAAPLVYRTLASIEQRLAPGLFFRANRQQLVNLSTVVAVEPAISGGFLLRLRCGTEVEVSRRQSAELRQQLSL